jgi:hypothetical protein
MGRTVARAARMMFAAFLLCQATLSASIIDRCETCHVGFIATATVVSARSRFEDKFGQIAELYKDSDNSAIRRKDFEGGGLASFRLLDNVQSYDDSYDKGNDSFDEYKP